MRTEDVLKLLTKLTSKQGSWELSYNEHKTCYENPKYYFNVYNEDLPDVDFTKDIYCLRWHNITPVSYYFVLKNSLEEILEWVLESEETDD